MIQSKTITRICENCSSEFQVLLRETKRKPRSKQSNRYGRFCSISCKNQSMRIQLTCTTCGKQFQRTKSVVRTQLKETPNAFCSKSCAAKYNNTHKTYGTRRSKLEAYLEQQIRSEFSNLELICNGKNAIGSELDFYFPQLRLAIELNGIFHYEPIYGIDRLERTQANDQQKYANCLAAGIELCIVSCTEKHVTSNVKERYWTIVRNLVIPLLGRASGTNVQVS